MDDIVFDTFLVAYFISGRPVHAIDAFECDADGALRVFRRAKSESRIRLEYIGRFRFLVPDATEFEQRLDYEQRAVIGRGRQFRRGDSISHISESRGKDVATLKTQVAQRSVPKGGPYACSNLVLLTPELQTLSVAD